MHTGAGPGAVLLHRRVQFHEIKVQDEVVCSEHGRSISSDLTENVSQMTWCSCAAGQAAFLGQRLQSFTHLCPAAPASSSRCQWGASLGKRKGWGDGSLLGGML